MEGVSTPPPPDIQNDPDILELRKKLEMKRLKNALEDLDETPKISDMAERLRRLEMIINKDIENFKTQQKNQDQTLRVVTDWISYLRNDDELHKHNISNLLVAFAVSQENEEMLENVLKAMKSQYGLTADKDGNIISIEHTHAENAKQEDKKQAEKSNERNR